MATQANIVAFDGAATPVSHTFVPTSSSTDEAGVKTAEWAERLASVPLEAQISVKTTKKKLKTGVEQVTLAVKVPVMESVSGQNAAGYTAAPKVAFEDTIVLTGYFSPRSTIANRRLARMLAVNISNNISTTVAAAVSGPLADLFDSSIVAS